MPAQTAEELILMYRHTMRRMLYAKGVPSNPGVDDEWILDETARLLGLPPQDKSNPFDKFSSTTPRL